MEIIRSRLLAHRDRARQLQAAAAAPRDFAARDAPLYNHLRDVLIEAGRPIPSRPRPIPSRPRATTAPVRPEASSLSEPAFQGRLTFPKQSRNPAALPVTTSIPHTVTNANSAPTSSNAEQSAAPVLAILASRFTPEREDYAFITTSAYYTAYSDLLSVMRVQALCHALGINPAKPSDTVRIENLDVSYQHVQQFLGASSGLKNAFTLYNKVIKVKNHLESRSRGTLVEAETLLLQQLDVMLSGTLISSDNQDPVAAQAFRLTRVKLNKVLNECETRRGMI